MLVVVCCSESIDAVLLHRDQRVADTERPAGKLRRVNKFRLKSRWNYSVGCRKFGVVKSEGDTGLFCREQLSSAIVRVARFVFRYKISRNLLQSKEGQQQDREWRIKEDEAVAKVKTRRQVRGSSSVIQ